VNRKKRRAKRAKLQKKDRRKIHTSEIATSSEKTLVRNDKPEPPVPALMDAVFDDEEEDTQVLPDRISLRRYANDEDVHTAPTIAP
jgi:hypothetical protein